MKKLLFATAVVLILCVLPSRVNGQRSSTYESFTISKGNLQPKIERDLDARFVDFSKATERINFSLDLKLLSISATLQARTEVWAQDLGHSGRMNFRKNRLGYSYNPKDFREGPLGSSLMPLMRFIFER